LKVTSDNKVMANRANARTSTGPKTMQGRTRSARNALRHALSLPVYSNLVLCEEVDALAREIAAAGALAAKICDSCLRFGTTAAEDCRL
jgi:hypothetical protein